MASKTVVPSSLTGGADNSNPWAGTVSAVQNLDGTQLTCLTGDVAPEFTDTEIFNFLPDLPASALTIVGIEFTIRAKTDANFSSILFPVIPSVNSVEGFDVGVSDAVTAGYQTFTYGGPTELFGFTPTVAHVNAGVGLRVGIAADPDNVNTHNIDYVTCTVYYTEPASSGLNSVQKLQLLEEEV